MTNTSTFILYHHLRSPHGLRDSYWGGSTIRQEYENPINLIAEYKRWNAMKDTPEQLAVILGDIPNTTKLLKQAKTTQRELLKKDSYSPVEIRSILISDDNNQFKRLMTDKGFLNSPTLYQEALTLFNQAKASVKSGDLTAMPQLYRCYAVIESAQVTSSPIKVKRNFIQRGFSTDLRKRETALEESKKLFKQHFPNYIQARVANSADATEIEQKVARAIDRLRIVFKPEKTIKLETALVEHQDKKAQKIWSQLTHPRIVLDTYEKMEHFLFNDVPVSHLSKDKSYMYRFSAYADEIEKIVIAHPEEYVKWIRLQANMLMSSNHSTWKNNKSTRDQYFEEFLSQSTIPELRELAPLVSGVVINSEKYAHFEKRKMNYTNALENLGYKNLFTNIQNMRKSNKDRPRVFLDNKVYRGEVHHTDNSLREYFATLSSQDIKVIVDLKSPLEGKIPKKLGNSVTESGTTVTCKSIDQDPAGTCYTYEVVGQGIKSTFQWIKPSQNLEGPDNINNLRAFSRFVEKYHTDVNPLAVTSKDNESLSQFILYYHLSRRDDNPRKVQMEHRQGNGISYTYKKVSTTKTNPIQSMVEYRLARNGVENIETLASVMGALWEDKKERNGIEG